MKYPAHARVQVFPRRIHWLAGIELMHMIRKGQMAMPECEGLSFSDQFYALAGQVRPA